ncbi:class I SAM-dependent methyltransferase [Demequina lutea]|uniref:SAM-dependent methyltransferase n=1 Tax=Demequina lutea TaxID=431489 RepID=A0A7Z0CL07_9MICO|nr:class I SAM-dependent methyltransferase [Demequina lutea]NYI42270.1 SAM-dependent methyltransferase [Demequina lutea]
MSAIGTSFGTAAGDYEKGRPGYPPEAVAWILGQAPLRVLDAGAGTGKLTAEVLRRGHEVIALDPDAAMLEALSRSVPGVETRVGAAEATGLPASSVDAVVFGQAWHWVDVAEASAEMARILRPGGVLGLIWNIRDESVPWVARLTEVMHGSAAEQLLAGSGPTVGVPFGPLEHRAFNWAREMTADELVAMARSRSYYITGNDANRARTDAGIVDLMSTLPALAKYDRIDLPYVTHGFRVRRPNVEG